MSDWISRRHDHHQSYNTIDELLRELTNSLKREFQVFPHNTPKNMLRTFDLPDDTKVEEWRPHIYRYYVTIGSEGNPRMHEFGKYKPETRDEELKLNTRAIKEPLIDVLPRADYIQVVAELPGVKKQDIHLHVTGTILTIEVNSPHRQYFKKITLPTTIDAIHASSTYTNGVLAVKLPKENPEQSQNQSSIIE